MYNLYVNNITFGYLTWSVRLETVYIKGHNICWPDSLPLHSPDQCTTLYATFVFKYWSRKKYS